MDKTNLKVDELAWNILGARVTGNAIEVGAVDGVFFSNTLAFEQAGWNVLCIEPNPECWAALQRNRKHVQPYAVSNRSGEADLKICDIREKDHTAVTAIELDQRLVAQYGASIVQTVKVPMRTLDQCIAEFGGFQSIEYVSIDTEGTELDVLKGFDIQKWRPRLILVENNYDDAAIAAYMETQGYHRIKRHGVNDFFVPLRVEIKSIGVLIDELITTCMKCWFAQDGIAGQDATKALECCKNAQKLNARRNALMRAIDARMGDDASSPTLKTYQ
jgi:FkbM family methyltransferase